MCKTKICYLEDYLGGFLCYSEDKEYFLNENTNPVICAEGTFAEISEYLNKRIDVNDIKEVK